MCELKFNISLLIFHLDDLPIIEGGVLKPPTITVLFSISSFNSINIFNILSAPICDAKYLQILYPSDKLTLLSLEMRFLLN